MFKSKRRQVIHAAVHPRKKSGLWRFLQPSLCSGGHICIVAESVPTAQVCWRLKTIVITRRAAVNSACRILDKNRGSAVHFPCKTTTDTAETIQRLRLLLSLRELL
jgi:hypothetical protein